MLHFAFLEQESNKLNLEGINSIPSFYYKNVNKKWWKYTIGYHFHIPPDDVEDWDNDSILEHLASLKVMGVIK